MHGLCTERGWCPRRGGGGMTLAAWSFPSLPIHLTPFSVTPKSWHCGLADCFRPRPCGKPGFRRTASNASASRACCTASDVASMSRRTVGGERMPASGTGCLFGRPPWPHAASPFSPTSPLRCCTVSRSSADGPTRCTPSLPVPAEEVETDSPQDIRGLLRRSWRPHQAARSHRLRARSWTWRRHPRCWSG